MRLGESPRASRVSPEGAPRVGRVRTTRELRLDVFGVASFATHPRCGMFDFYAPRGGKSGESDNFGSRAAAVGEIPSEVAQ